MVIRVLIINRQLVFAVTIKQALEQTGAFVVHPFTDPSAAMEYLRSNPHDVALVDFAIKVMPGPEIVRRLREIQPEIAVIVSPQQPTQVIRELNLQGMVDAPFSARGIIPIIEHAVDQVSQPFQATTRSFIEPDAPTSVDTEVLGRTVLNETLPPRRGEPTKTRILDEDDEPENLPAPRTLNAPPRRGDPAKTRILDDEDDNEPENRPQTRILSEPPRQGDPAKTRILDDEDDNEPENRPQTRILDSGTDNETFAPPFFGSVPAQTRILDDDSGDEPTPLPPSLPEFSSLGHILTDEAPSSLFEPAIRDEDTPAVPDVDSDAVRQYLATRSDTDDRLFDQMLGEIEADEGDTSDAEPRQLPGAHFRDLVDSMRAEPEYKPLPDRHQQFVEFILTGGMDGLLTEIEKAKTDPLDESSVPDTPPKKSRPTPPPPKPEPKAKPKTTFDQLAAEEPPLPGLEESGTIGDLMVGVSDTSFRNVLAMMRGDQMAEEAEPVDSDAPSRYEIEAAYQTFLAQEPPEDEDELPPASLPGLPDEDEPSITAQLILETALDESTPPDAFSLNNVIDIIEKQLAEHRPEIHPLPSWNLSAFPAPTRRLDKPEKPGKSRKSEKSGDTERYIREPDFLPEEFPAEPIRAAAAETSAEDETADDLWELFERARSERIVAEPVEIETPAAAEPEKTEPQPEPAVEPEWLAQVEQPAPEPAVEPEWLTQAEQPVPEPAVEPEWLTQAEQPAPEPAVEPEWLPEASASDEATVVSATFETELTAPPVLPEAQPVPPPAPLPDNLWDDWPESWSDEQPEWDQETVVGAPAEPVNTIPPVSAPVEPPPVLPSFDDDWELAVDEAPDDRTTILDRPHVAPAPVTLGLAADFDLPGMDADIAPDDPYIAQIALSLTQVSLELAAEATLLTSDDEIIAFAGNLDEGEVAELRAAIKDDWDANANQARIRFLTLASSGRDYMLYSRKTVNDLTLSMIFAGTTPLRDIRRQGRRLIEALEAVPEVESAPAVIPSAPPVLPEMPAPAPTPEPVPVILQPFTYLWLLRDPQAALSQSAARAIVTGLNLQLAEQGWQIRALRAQNEYVYIHADVPGDQPAYTIIDDLKQRAADIVRAQEPHIDTDRLWADSYLVMMPGRELGPDEIDQFITFERMA
jgi:CheY-like chemotaxis protein